MPNRISQYNKRDVMQSSSAIGSGSGVGRLCSCMFRMELRFPSIRLARAKNSEDGTNRLLRTTHFAYSEKVE
jgi:hypothetical protein